MADVNSARRTDRLKREIARRLGKNAPLIDTTVVDPKAFEERRRHRAADNARDEPAAEASPELHGIKEEMRRQQWNHMAGWLQAIDSLRQAA